MANIIDLAVWVTVAASLVASFKGYYWLALGMLVAALASEVMSIAIDVFTP